MEYKVHIWLTRLCCCFKDTGCFKRRTERNSVYQESIKRLSVETDIVQMIEQLRLSRFLTRISFASHQKKLVQSFRQYNLDQDKPYEPKIITPSRNIDRLLLKFDPEESQIDKRILYEITGHKIADDPYWDTSDEDGERGELVDDAGEEPHDHENNPNQRLIDKGQYRLNSSEYSK